MGFKLDFRALFGQTTDRLFAMALTHPDVFHGAARPILHGHADGDVIRAQSLALEGLWAHLPVVQRHSEKFLRQYNDKVSFEPLAVPVAGHWTTPVGTGCGVDPDAEGLEPLSYLFGFQMPGLVSLRPSELARAPFQEDTRRPDLFVPPAFVSRGREHFLRNLRQYREHGGTAVVLPAVIGETAETESPNQADDDLRALLTALAPYADGFVWAPSPARSVDGLSPADFHGTARLMSETAPGKLHLAEMPAYEEVQRDAWLGLVDAFLAGGGNGLVAVRGLDVPKSRVPKPDRWPFETALLCGASVAAYRQRAVEDARRAFPAAFIVACGGFHNRDAAFDACQYANVIVENEALTRFGPGIARLLLSKLALRLNFLHKQGAIPSARLIDYQRAQWSGLQPERSGAV